MKLLQMLGLLCGPSLIVLALAGFVVWNWNPAEWDPLQRFVVVVMAVGGTLIGLIGYAFESGKRP